MQVNSGKNRGTRLFSPIGEDVRPTSDKVKQAIFNIISFFDLGESVLDLFAGSGAMGIEALSRGWEKCDFCDLDTSYVKKNIEKCRLNDKSLIHCGDFRDFLKSAFEDKKKYSLVFLDPPYHKGLLEKALKLLSEYELLGNGCIVVMESDSLEDYNIPEDIKTIKEKCYGRIKICIGVYEK